jgi:hypothetical protein
VLGSAVELLPLSTLVTIPVTRLEFKDDIISEEGVFDLDVVGTSIRDNAELGVLADMWSKLFPKASGNSVTSTVSEFVSGTNSSGIVYDVTEIVALEDIVSGLQDSYQRNILRETEAIDTYIQTYILDATSQIRKDESDSPQVYIRTIRFYTLLARMGLILKPHHSQAIYDAIRSDEALISYDAAFSRLNTKTNALAAYFRTEEEVPLSGPFFIFDKLCELLNLIFKNISPNEWSSITRSIFGISTGFSFASMVLPLLLKSCCPSIRQTIIDTITCCPSRRDVEGPSSTGGPPLVENIHVRRSPGSRARAGSQGAGRRAITAGSEGTALVSTSTAATSTAATSTAVTSAASTATTATASSFPVPQLTNGTNAPGTLVNYGSHLAMDPRLTYGQMYHPVPQYPAHPFPVVPFQPPIQQYAPPYYQRQGFGPMLQPPYPMGGAMVLRTGPPGTLVTSGEALANAVMAQRTNAPGAPSASEIIRQLTNNPVTAGLLQDALERLEGGDRAALDRWIKSAGKGPLLTSNSSGTSRKRTYKRKNARTLTRKRRVA